MNNKFSSIFFKGLNHKEKNICSNVLIQSSFLFFMLMAGGFLLLSNIKIVELFQIWDIFFLSLAMGYGYFVIKAAWKGVLYGEKKTNTHKHSTCVRFSFISIGMIIMSCLYWQAEVFLYDPQRIQFGIFIISGTLIGIFYTVSVWIDLYKSKS